MKLIYVVLVMLTSLVAVAEYRVFQLSIYKDPKPGLGAIDDDRRVISSLDPEQYPAYYPLAADEKIRYIDTWMCKGRTDHKEFCSNPRLKPQEEAQSSSNDK